eukprot:jgi/Tetstr1/426305/TSEL_016621.t1
MARIALKSSAKTQQPASTHFPTFRPAPPTAPPPPSHKPAQPTSAKMATTRLSPAVCVGVLLAVIATAHGFPARYTGCTVPTTGLGGHGPPVPDDEITITFTDSNGSPVTAYAPGQTYTIQTSQPASSRGIIVANIGTLSGGNAVGCENKKVTWGEATTQTATWTAPESGGAELPASFHLHFRWWHCTRYTRPHPSRNTCSHPSHNTCPHPSGNTCSHPSGNTGSHSCGNTCFHPSGNTCPHSCGNTCSHSCGNTCPHRSRNTCSHRSRNTFSHSCGNTCPHRSRNTCSHRSRNTCSHPSGNTRSHSCGNACSYVCGNTHRYP